MTAGPLDVAHVPIPTTPRRREGTDILSRLQARHAWVSPIEAARRSREGDPATAPAAPRLPVPSQPSPKPPVKRRSPRRGQPASNAIPAAVQRRVLDEYAAGNHYRGIADELGISRTSVGNIVRRAGASRTPSEAMKGRPGIDHGAALRELMAANGITTTDVHRWSDLMGIPHARFGMPSRDAVEAYLLHTRGTRRAL